MHRLGRKQLELRPDSQKNPSLSYILIPIAYVSVMKLIMLLSVLLYRDDFDASSILSPSSWETYDALVWDAMDGVYYEIIYRLVILGLVGYTFSRFRYGFECAIFTVALFEALFHSTERLPPSITFTYVFLTGITLGFLFKRFGIFVPILCSLLFNLLPV